MDTSDRDIYSFVSKFRELWAAGKVAQLNVECHHGVATVGLRVQLGRAPVPVYRHHGQHQPGLRKTPAQQRRKARRAAERAAAAKEVAENAVEDSINAAVKIAEEAVTRKEAEKASIARTMAAVVAVGSTVAAASKKIAVEAMKMAEEAAAKKKAEEAAAEEAAKKKKIEDDAAAQRRAAEEGTAAVASETKAVMADVEIAPAKERISTYAFLKGRFEKNTDQRDLDTMKIPPRWPAPEWFCDLLGTRKHHGHVKFIISDTLRHLIGRHSDYVITNYMFTKKLWAFMSHRPPSIERD